MIGDRQLAQIQAFVAASPKNGAIQVIVNHSATSGLEHVYIRRSGSDQMARLDPGHATNADACMEGEVVRQIVGALLIEQGSTITEST